MMFESLIQEITELEKNIDKLFDEIKKIPDSQGELLATKLISFGIENHKLELKIEELKEKEKNLSALRKTWEENLDVLKTSCVSELKRRKLTQVQKSGHTLSILDSIFVDVIDAGEISFKWIKIKVADSVDKAGILSWFKKTGEIVSGVDIKPREHYNFK
ncbi:siphovirus Gp157 family protein [Acidithiobacillus sp.]|uniref:siphovirus Gp157 family protein n=1 Tax=Acidithiobacillus sp. TaxID=1872118 RepID=UPI0035637F1A